MVTVLKGGTLIDGTGSDPVSPAVLVMDGEWIVGVGKEGEVDIPAGAEVLDVTGKTVLPGLINNHSHLHWDGVNDLKEQCLNDSPMVTAITKAVAPPIANRTASMMAISSCFWSFSDSAALFITVPPQ